MNLYKPLHARLCRYVQSLVWQQDDAKDLISDITLHAFERFETIKDPNLFVYFLFGIARHLFLKKLRKQKFKAAWNDNEMENLVSANTTDDMLQKRELTILLNKLKPLQSEALTLYEIAGFSYEEIARIQQSNLSQVKAHIFKGRQALKALLEKEEKRILHLNKMELEKKLNMKGLL